jgi:hypothetical protein
MQKKRIVVGGGVRVGEGIVWKGGKAMNLEGI